MRFDGPKPRRLFWSLAFVTFDVTRNTEPLPPSAAIDIVVVSVVVVRGAKFTYLVYENIRTDVSVSKK